MKYRIDMKSTATTPEEYINELPEERKDILLTLRKVILENLPPGFSEEMNYGMIGYVVPHSVFPEGYHCNPKLPLPFMNLAYQKKFIGLYHMGIYSNPELLNWFETEYYKLYKTKLDIGKSCIRFKKAEKVPEKLIAQLVRKITVADWIKQYRKNLKN